MKLLNLTDIYQSKEKLGGDYWISPELHLPLIFSKVAKVTHHRFDIPVLRFDGFYRANDTFRR